MAGGYCLGPGWKCRTRGVIKFGIYSESIKLDCDDDCTTTNVIDALSNLKKKKKNQILILWSVTGQSK